MICIRNEIRWEIQISNEIFHFGYSTGNSVGIEYQMYFTISFLTLQDYSKIYNEIMKFTCIKLCYLKDCLFNLSLI